MHFHHHISARLVWAKLRRQATNTYDKRAGDRPGTVNGFGNSEFGSGNSDGHAAPGGGGNGKGSPPASDNKSFCQEFPQSPFCSIPPPHPISTSKPETAVTSRPNEQVTTQPQASPLAGSNSTPAPSITPNAVPNISLGTGSDANPIATAGSSPDGGSGTSSASPAVSSSGSPATSPGNPSQTQSPELTNGQSLTGSTSSLSPSPMSTSRDTSSLPFGADPTGAGATPSDTASSGSGIGSASTATSQGPDVGAIAGGIIGTISFVLLLLFVVWLLRRRRRRNRIAPSAEFFSDTRYPFTASSHFQSRRNHVSQFDVQSERNDPGVFPSSLRETPKSFLHLSEKSSLS